MVDIDTAGRITLPTDVRGLVDGPRGTVRAAARRLALVPSDSDAVAGFELRVDSRGRLPLPVWLRRQAEPAGAVLLAVRQPEGALVVVTPAGALDAVADSVVREGVA